MNTNNIVRFTRRRVLAGILLPVSLCLSATAQDSATFTPITRYTPSVSVEALTATQDGKTLIFLNPTQNSIGFIDISNPAEPVEEDLSLSVGGTPNGVAVINGRYAIAVVAQPYNSLSGQYAGSAVVIDLRSKGGPSIVRTIQLGGQPDSVAVSPDGRYAAITIENERIGNDLNVTPAGFLAILDLQGNPANWGLRTVSLTGLADIAPNDPEPEYVDINQQNQAAITLQENNHIVIVDLPSGTVVSDFSAGQVKQPADLTNGGGINFTQELIANREPDAIAWTPGGNLVIANEGDLTSKAGGRNFTIFSPEGEIVFDPGASLEMLAADAGLYRDNRSAARGAEINTVRVEKIAGQTYLFASSEKMDFVAVYTLGPDESSPEFVQFLRTGDEPEGMVVIRNRRLLVTGNEDDDTIDIFKLQR